ncbi:glycoside hydrolase family 65 protein [Actinomycetota bacterium]
MNTLDPQSDPVDRTRFPAEPWRLVEADYRVEDLGTAETLFALGNGYLGMRGNPEEGRDAHTHGTFINGFHETWGIKHAEEAYGFAKTGQTIVNAPDSKLIKLYVDDEPLLMSTADLQEYERSVDFRDGQLRRKLIWRTPSGKRVCVTTSRMISFTERHLALMTYDVEMLEGDAPIVISSQILNRQDGIDEYHQTSEAMGEGFDPRKAAKFAGRVLEPQGHWYSERGRIIMGYRCAKSGMTLAVGADHTIETDNQVEELISTEDDLAKKVYRIHAKKGQPVRITKSVAYHSSRGVPARELFDRCRRTLDRVRESSIEAFQDDQREWLETFWRNADIEIPDNVEVQQAVRWNLFQLAQASARSDQMGVSAKGVTGSGYEGHYFWDTEVYVLPFLAYTMPSVARNLLRFRANILPKARERAREMAQRGALFPWRTINGDEASAYYAAGTAQYHIDADIAFAVMKYVRATGDEDFLRRDGVEILVETARMWADLGFWRFNGESSFHIHGVTGPDEYTTVVNNNLFTNVMARHNLEGAVEAVRHLEESAPDEFARIARRLELEPAEVDEWAACAEHMFVPYDETLGVHPQDEHFLERELWDLASTPPDKRPLLLHYHPLVIYRFQVLKQADVVLALFLQGDRFTAEEKKADFDYYDPITTGDSTLSAVVQSIIASEVGYSEMALRYFLSGLFVDLADMHSNTSDGAHIASTGGVWSALVFGFGGMRDYQGQITFDPRLPAEWPSLTFPITLCGNRIRVRIEQDAITFRSEGKSAVSVGVRGERYAVEPGQEVRVALDGQGPRLPSLEGTIPVIGGKRADGTIITAGVPDPLIAAEEQLLPGSPDHPREA